jgi:hypothetical protein
MAADTQENATRKNKLPLTNSFLNYYIIQIDRFKDKVDLMSNLGLMLFFLLAAIFVEPMAGQNSLKSRLTLCIAIVAFCTYRMLKHFPGLQITWNLRNSYVLIGISHFGFYGLWVLAKIIYTDNFIRKYDLGVISSFFDNCMA